VQQRLLPEADDVPSPALELKVNTTPDADNFFSREDDSKAAAQRLGTRARPDPLALGFRFTSSSFIASVRFPLMGLEEAAQDPPADHPLLSAAQLYPGKTKPGAFAPGLLELDVTTAFELYTTP